MPRDRRKNVSRDYIYWYDNRRRYVDYWLHRAGPINFGRRFKIKDFQTFNDALDFANTFHYKGVKDALDSLRRSGGRWYKWGHGDGLPPHIVQRIADHAYGYPDPPED